jgi:hypothetical protein
LSRLTGLTAGELALVADFHLVASPRLEVLALGAKLFN